MDNKPFKKRCSHCKKYQSAYKKIYYIDGYEMRPDVIFYVCENPNCFMRFDIKLGEKIKVYNEVFEWYKIDL